MTIYERPTKELMREFAAETLTAGQTFDKNQAVAWFRRKYPNLKPGTVTTHVEGMATNSAARIHYRNVKPGSGHDVFFKVAPGRFRLWDETNDPPPLYASGSPEPAADVSDRGDEYTEAPVVTSDGVDGAREFAFERDLRNYLAKNLHLLEKDLRLYQDEEFSGVEFPVGGRFIDILAVDALGRYVWPAPGSADSTLS